MPKRLRSKSQFAYATADELREALMRSPYAAVQQIDGQLWLNHKRVKPEAVAELTAEGFIKKQVQTRWVHRMIGQETDRSSPPTGSG